MKSINQKLLLMFLLIFVPFVITIVVAFITFGNMEDDGVAINLSGSQRMRTMLISNYAVQVHEEVGQEDDLAYARDVLGKELPKYKQIMNALVLGDQGYQIGLNKDQEIINSFKAIEGDYTRYIDSAQRVLDNSADISDLQFLLSNAMLLKNDINEIVSMYQSNYNQKVSRFKGLLIGLSMFGALMLLFGIFYGRKLIVQPIIKINDKLEEIASGNGDLTHKLEVASNDEIGMLSNNFNQFVSTIREMVVEISASSDSLEGISNTLEGITTEVSKSSEKLSSISTEIADGATEQATDVMETAENLSELGEEIDEINTISQLMEQNSIEIQKINDVSKNSMVALHESNQHNIVASNEINDAIGELHERVLRISTITEAINDISTQTNLLALNASIEAARAGEHGKGFSVVANEVSKLAEESNTSTIEISAIVSEIQKQVRATKGLMENVLELSKNQSQAVEKSKNDFDNVSGSLKEMLERISSMNARIEVVDHKKVAIVAAIQNVASVSEETAASTEEVAAFTDEFKESVEEIAFNATGLRTSSQSLSEMISKFKY